MTYQVGQIVPHEVQPLCQPGTPAWFILITAPQDEAKAQAWLQSRSIFSFYPVEKKRVLIVRQGSKTYRKIEVPIVPRYLFAKMPGNPRWHILKRNPFVSGVVGHLGIPRPVRSEEIKILKKLKNTAAKIEANRIAAAEIRKGDVVEISEGPLSDFVVDVIDVQDKIERISLGLLGKTEMTVNLSALRKLD